MIAGTSGLTGSARGRMTVLAVVIGLTVGYLAAMLFGGTTLIGALFGALGAGLACPVVSDVKLGASRRKTATGGGGALGVLIAAAALLVALLTLLFAPLALLFAAGLAWLAISRSRKGDRKHAGLRVLR